MDAHGLEPAEKVSAGKKLGRAFAVSILETSGRVIVSKGRRVEEFDTAAEGGERAPGEEDVLDHLLGPTGNLRAPCVRSGATTLVGFNDEVWSRVLVRSSTDGA